MVHLTVMLQCNARGTEKLCSFIIRKSNNHTVSSTQYETSRKVWMTLSFEQQINALDIKK
jgi:hypothetical protein